MAYKSRFTPKNTHKYMGDPSKIICRSLWERKVCKYLDSNTNIIRWSSEEVVVPYYSPVDKKVRRYFPDFVIEKKDKDDSVETIMIEVKPLKQTQRPKRGKKSKKLYLNECMTYETNQAKWKYAKDFCASRGWKFLILTENDIFSKNK